MNTKTLFCLIPRIFLIFSQWKWREYLEVNQNYILLLFCELLLFPPADQLFRYNFIRKLYNTFFGIFLEIQKKTIWETEITIFAIYWEISVFWISF